jgi:hypothetical protein
MARVLDAFPKRPGPAQKYPWDTWLDGQVWELRVGEDFDAKAATIRSRAQAEAKKRTGRARTSYISDEAGERVIIQFRPRAGASG